MFLLSVPLPTDPLQPLVPAISVRELLLHPFQSVAPISIRSLPSLLTVAGEQPPSKVRSPPHMATLWDQITPCSKAAILVPIHSLIMHLTLDLLIPVVRSVPSVCPDQGSIPRGRYLDPILTLVRMRMGIP